MTRSLKGRMYQQTLQAAAIEDVFHFFCVGRSSQNVQFYIGLEQSSSSVTTSWIDGSTSTYRNYASGVPSGNGCFTMMNDGLFYDVTCGQKLGYICKVPPGNDCADCTELLQSYHIMTAPVHAVGVAR